MENNYTNSRRSFLKSAAKTAVMAAVTPVAGTISQTAAASNIHLQPIGANDRERSA